MSNYGHAESRVTPKSPSQALHYAEWTARCGCESLRLEDVLTREPTIPIALLGNLCQRHGTRRGWAAACPAATSTLTDSQKHISPFTQEQSQQFPSRVAQSPERSVKTMYPESFEGFAIPSAESWNAPKRITVRADVIIC